MKTKGALQISEAKAAKMLGEVEGLFSDSEERWRWKHGPRTLENVAFYRGIQYLQKTKPTDPRVADVRGEMMEVINFSQTLINEGVADALSQVPSLKIASAKNDPRARGRADMTEKLGQSFMRNGVIDYDEIFNATLWAFITGAAWVKVGWDPFSGRHLRSVRNGFDDSGDEDDYEGIIDVGETPLARVSPYEGEIFCEYVNSADGLPCSTAKNAKPREMTHFFHRKLKSERDATNMWAVDAFGKSTRGRWDDGSGTTESTFIRAASDQIDGSIGSGYNEGNSDPNRLVQIVEFWELPSRMFQNGRLIIFSGPMILYIGENPYTPARIPFVLFRGPNRVPDGIYPDGMMESLKPLQRTANKLATKIVEIANKMANPHLLVPIGSGIDKNTWGNIPGQTIPYFKGFKPELLNAAEVPQWLFQHLNDQINRAQFLTGMSDLTRGAGSSGSGRDRAFAEEQQQKLRGPHRQTQRNALLQVTQQCVWLARERYEDGRIVRMLGEDVSEMDLVEFRGDDYDWDNDFIPEPYDDEPQSLSARMQTGLQILSAGGFGETPDAERYRRYVGQYLGRKAAYDVFDKDRAKAQRENQQIDVNPMYDPPVDTVDIHRIHIEEHGDFMKTPQFEQWPDWKKAKLRRHNEIHSLADQLTEAMAQERENMMGAKPPPPGMNTGAPNPQQLPAGGGTPSPADGGAAPTPGPPPSIDEFNSMSPSEQRSSDQQ